MMSLTQTNINKNIIWEEVSSLYFDWILLNEDPWDISGTGLGI